MNTGLRFLHASLSASTGSSPRLVISPGGGEVFTDRSQVSAQEIQVTIEC